ncbi:MAG: JmjC domain-containing protein [Pseudonocardiaceae bacterium]
MSTEWIPNTAFWTSEFPSRTVGRTIPELFKQLFPPAVVDAHDVLDGLRALREAKLATTGTTAKARVYVGEDRRDDLVDHVLAADAWPDNDDFVAGMQSLVGAERFSLIVNNLETTSERLSAGFGQLLGSVFEGWGVPAGGAEQVAFIGNYSGTAFGVHEGYEDAFLVHLGPGVKNFYCWSPEVYEKQTGSTRPLFGDYTWLLQHGQLFVLEPGDVLFLPRRVFHVGMQSEFSVSVAIPLYTYPDIRLLRFAVMPEVLDAALDNEAGGMFEPSPMHDLSAGWRPAVDRLSPLMLSALGKATAGLDGLLSAALSRRWHAMLSNGGWEVVDLDLARDAAVAAHSDELIAPGAAVRLRAPYQIRLDETGRAYLRGAAVAAPHGPFPCPLVARFNSGDHVELPDDPAMLAEVRALAATGGIQVGPFSDGIEKEQD